jgi:hypothetical protein
MLTFAIVFALRWKSWAIPACPARVPAFRFEPRGGRQGRGRGSHWLSPAVTEILGTAFV